MKLSNEGFICQPPGGQSTHYIRHLSLKISILLLSMSTLLHLTLLPNLKSIAANHWREDQDHRRTEFGAKDVIQFHQQDFTQLYLHIHLDITPNSYAMSSILYASKMSVNLLLVEC